MKAICERRELAEAVGTAIRAVPTRTALPIQSHFLLRAESGQLCLTGADYELQIQRRFGAQVIEGGACTVVARVMADLVNSLGEGNVQIESDGEGHVHLKSGGSSYDLMGLPPEEYPPLPQVDAQSQFMLPSALFRELVRHTAFAAGDDPSRPQLTGINLMVEGDRIKLAATDGSRLAVRQSSLEEPVGTPVSCIVPARALNEAARILTESESRPRVGDEAGAPATPGGPSSIEVSATPSQIQFTQPHVTVVSRLIEGQFPPFERVIPTGGDKQITIKTSDLLTACRRCAFVAADTHRLVFKTQGDQLCVQAESSGYGRGREELEVLKTGEDIEIAFDSRYLIDYLGTVGSEGVTVTLSQPLSPGVWRPADGPDFTYVLMPMHLM